MTEERINELLLYVDRTRKTPELGKYLSDSQEGDMQKLFECLTEIKACHEALRKCAETFRQYEKIHMDKLPNEPVTTAIMIVYCSDVEDKIQRNRKMAELCEERLK
jgi:hypothetical protein